jgi:pyridoxal phosphate enzyme (YggS family)
MKKGREQGSDAELDPAVETRIRANLDEVRSRMARAAERAGRTPESIRLVAVTKTVGPEIARILIRSGVEDLGENRIQPAHLKIDAIREPVRWHLIGHLQRNKVKRAVGAFHLIHSLDSERLAHVLSDASEKASRATDVLIQVNVSGEETKGGFSPEELVESFDRCRTLSGLRIRGLMTMAPFDDDPEAARPVFRRLRELRDELVERVPDGGPLLLSMGMTQDFETAIEEGADFIRVGSALYRGLEGAST